MTYSNKNHHVYTYGQLFGIFALFLAYAVVFNTVSTLIIPLEVDRLSKLYQHEHSLVFSSVSSPQPIKGLTLKKGTNQRVPQANRSSSELLVPTDNTTNTANTQTKQTLWVGIIMCAGALCQLVTPLIGYYSDHSDSGVGDADQDDSTLDGPCSRLGILRCLVFATLGSRRSQSGANHFHYRKHPVQRRIPFVIIGTWLTIAGISGLLYLDYKDAARVKSHSVTEGGVQGSLAPVGGDAVLIEPTAKAEEQRMTKRGFSKSSAVKNADGDRADNESTRTATAFLPGKVLSDDSIKLRKRESLIRHQQTHRTILYFITVDQNWFLFFYYFAAPLIFLTLNFILISLGLAMLYSMGTAILNDIMMISNEMNQEVSIAPTPAVIQSEMRRACIESVSNAVDSVASMDDSSMMVDEENGLRSSAESNVASNPGQTHRPQKESSDMQVGQASGVIAVLCTIGSGVGYALFGVLQIPVVKIYIIFILCLFCCLIISLVHIVELYTEYCYRGTGDFKFPSLYRSFFTVSYTVVTLSVSSIWGALSSAAEYIATALCCLDSRSTRGTRQRRSPRPLKYIGILSSRCYRVVCGRPETRPKVRAGLGTGGDRDKDQLVVPGPNVDQPTPASKHRHAPFTMSLLWTGLQAAYTIPNPWLFPDFFFACSSRLLFNVALSGQLHLYYYFRDVLIPKVHQKPTEPQLNPVHMTSYLAVMALVGGSLAAIPAGYLSDKVLGKKCLVYIAVGCCIISLILFLTVDELSNRNSDGMRTIQTIQHIGILYGAGNVSYLTVDYAIGVLSLPHRGANRGGGTKVDALHPHVDASSETNAKNLGVFSMSATLGQLLGQLLFAALLDMFSNEVSVSSTTVVTAYSKSGFVCIYTLGGIFFFLSAVAVALIKNVN